MNALPFFYDVELEYPRRTDVASNSQDFLFVLRAARPAAIKSVQITRCSEKRHYEGPRLRHAALNIGYRVAAKLKVWNFAEFASVLQDASPVFSREKNTLGALTSPCFDLVERCRGSRNQRAVVPASPRR